MFGRTPLTPEQQVAKDRAEADRAREKEAFRARQAALDKERYDAMPHFIVRETREVTVKAGSLPDAIALASAAFKEGQSFDNTIKWNKPYGVRGNTVDAIRVTNIKAVEE